MISRRSFGTGATALGVASIAGVVGADIAGAATPLSGRHSPRFPSAKRVVRAFWESYSQKDLDASFEKYISKDLVTGGIDGSGGRESWLALEKAMFAAFADLSVTVLDQIAEGNKVATRLRTGGTHTGEFLGIPASGRVAFLSATSVDRVEGGQIVEHWVDVDFQAFLQKLSAPPTSK